MDAPFDGCEAAGVMGSDGAAVSLGTIPGWTANGTSGRGWIAVPLRLFAAWVPARAAMGAYFFTILVLVLVLATRESARRRIGAPAALGRP